jgi:hypothetical protein
MINAAKPITIISSGNFGPPIFLGIEKINDIIVVVTDKKTEFVFKLPPIFDPDRDKVDVILDFKFAYTFTTFNERKSIITLSPGLENKGRYLVSIIL